MPSLVSCCKNFIWPVFYVSRRVFERFSLMIAVAKNDNYVVFGQHPVCSIIVGEVSVSSFHMLLPASQIKNLVTNNSIVNIHVCECLLLGGNQQKCAIAAVSKNALPVQIDPAEQTQLAGRIFILVDDPSAFLKLYTTFKTLYPHEFMAPAWDILHRAVSVDGGSDSGQPPPTPPLRHILRLP